MVFTTMQRNLLLLGNLIVGAGTVIVLKEQSECAITINGVTQNYNHPFMQVFAMYLGESMCLLFYIIHKKKNKEQFEQETQKAIEQGKIPKINPLILSIPTMCDFVTSCLAFFALELMPASVYSMIRGGNIIITALFSVIFVKAKLHRQHILGMGLVIGGLFIVGLVSVLDAGNNDQSASNIIWGILLLILSFFTYSTQVILEQKYFSKYQLNPFQVVGIEGSWGLLISTVFISIFNFVPCSQNMDCPINGKGQKHLEDVPLYFEQVFSFKNQPDQPMLVIMIFLGIIGILFFNVLQMSVTKFISSLARNVIGVSNPALVWIVSLAIGWEVFNYIQLIGFIVLSFGTLIYNEILVIPFMGFNKNLKKNIKKEQEELLNDVDQEQLTDDDN